MPNQKNHGFGELPKERGDRMVFLADVFVSMFALIIGGLYRYIYALPIYSTEDMALSFALLSSFLLGKIIRPLVLFAEEYHHLETRYCTVNTTNEKIHKALNACCNSNLMILSIMWVLFTVMAWSNWPKVNNIIFLVTALIGCCSPLQISLCKAEISHMNETENKHVADGLAWSYYFGYLKFVLPSLDTMIEQAVRTKWEIDNRDARDMLSCKKLMVVIPLNCFCHKSFEDADRRITFKTSMPEIRKTRAGVQERVYKNTLYQVNDVTSNGKPLYVLIEYATPVMSMYDMSRHVNSKFSADDLECQVREFSKKLMEILDNESECRGRYELILIGAQNNLASVIHDIVENVNVEM